MKYYGLFGIDIYEQPFDARAFTLLLICFNLCSTHFTKLYTLYVIADKCVRLFVDSLVLS